MTRPSDDPFGERAEQGRRVRLKVLGGDFTLASREPALLQLAVDAFGGLPRLGLHSEPPGFQVDLVLSTQRKTHSRPTATVRPTLSSGAGLLCATVDAGNFAVIDAAMSRALISVSASMLRNPYYVRRELIELALLTLATRAQNLVPLHAACIGIKRRCVLLMGAGGTGKSTLSLEALAKGMQLLSEDAAFVEPRDLRVIGVPNFLYVRPGSLDFLEPGALRDHVESSPRIQKRGGKEKIEVDLRQLRGGIARSPQTLAATVFLSSRKAGRQPALQPLGRRAHLDRLRKEQPYALGRSNWKAFERRIVSIPAYELRRTSHPAIAIDLLRQCIT